MEIILSNSSNKPIYEQIVSQIKANIMNGTLKPGDSLPSIRGLAKSLHISVITSQRAYEDLVREGFIETVAGKGTFVSHQNRDFLREELLRQLEEKTEEIVEEAKLNGITLTQLIETITLLYEEE